MTLRKAKPWVPDSESSGVGGPGWGLPWPRGVGTGLCERCAYGAVFSLNAVLRKGAVSADCLPKTLVYALSGGAALLCLAVAFLWCHGRRSVRYCRPRPPRGTAWCHGRTQPWGEGDGVSLRPSVGTELSRSSALALEMMEFTCWAVVRAAGKRRAVPGSCWVLPEALAFGFPCCAFLG